MLQERRRIQIDTAGFLDKDEIKYPGAIILTRDDMNQVKISHDGDYYVVRPSDSLCKRRFY